MAKKIVNKTINLVAVLIGIIVSLAIGGLFTVGGFLGVPILNWLPLIVHKVVGWIIIVSTLLTAVLSLLK